MYRVNAWSQQTIKIRIRRYIYMLNETHTSIHICPYITSIKGRIETKQSKTLWYYAMWFHNWAIYITFRVLWALKAKARKNDIVSNNWHSKQRTLNWIFKSYCRQVNIRCNCLQIWIHIFLMWSVINKAPKICMSTKIIDFFQLKFLHAQIFTKNWQDNMFYIAR